MRLRLFLTFAFLILITLAGVAFFVRQGAAQEVRAFVSRGGMFGAQDLVEALEAHYQTTGTWQGAGTILAGRGPGDAGAGGRGRGPGPGGMTGQGMAASLRLTDAQGNLLYDPDQPQAAGQVDLAAFPGAIPLMVDGRTVGYLVPPSGMGVSNQDLEASLLARLNRASWNAALFAGVLALVLATLLAYSLLRPVGALTRAVRRMSQGDLSQRVPVGGPEELSALAQGFNDMAASLQQAQDSRRAMTADIAHELRTPLAVQRANLEALLDGVYPLTDENLAPILEQNRLLTRLVGDLRILALADAGELALERRPTDLTGLLAGLVDRFKPQASRQDVDLQLDFPSECPPLALDSGRVEQILNNLLDNALRYTPSGGQVRVRLACQGREAEVTVQDSGPGIPPEALPQLFERFYRGDRARSREAGGTGLGLAIARQLAEAHGGQLTAANHPEGGAVLRLVLPDSEQG